MIAALTHWARRLASVTLYTALCLVALVGLPLWLVLAALADLWRGDHRWPIVRCLALLFVYLFREVVGIAVSFALWLSRPARDRGERSRLTGHRSRYLNANFRVQCWWATTLFGSAGRIFGIRIEIDGDGVVQHGPLLLFMNHASIGDTVLPAVFIGARHRIMLRYVMKRELLWDPCLDIVGHRLPNAFVRRGSGASEREINRVQCLMDDLGPRDGVLLYPEGTFCTPAARERALTRLRGTVSPALLATASSLRHVLPPRLGGALALLEKNHGADVVFCAHTGFEDADTFRALLDGVLIHQTIRIRFWRIPFAEIPADAEARATWLYAQWTRIDDWIAAQRESLAVRARTTRS